MSSVQSVIAQPRRNVNEFAALSTPCYSDTLVNKILPVPFYVTDNGVLEVRIQDNVQANILTVGGAGGFTYKFKSNYPYKGMGGNMLATSLGQTAIDFINTYIYLNESSNLPEQLELVVEPVMTKVQLSTNPNQFETDIVGDPTSYQTSAYEPSGVNAYVTGSEADKYRTVWVFKTPMTVKYYSTESSTYKTLNLITQLY